MNTCVSHAAKWALMNIDQPGIFSGANRTKGQDTGNILCCAVMHECHDAQGSARTAFWLLLVPAFGVFSDQSLPRERSECLGHIKKATRRRHKSTAQYHSKNYLYRLNTPLIIPTECTTFYWFRFNYISRVVNMRASSHQTANKTVKISTITHPNT